MDFNSFLFVVPFVRSAVATRECLAVKEEEEGKINDVNRNETGDVNCSIKKK